MQHPSQILGLIFCMWVSLQPFTITAQETTFSSPQIEFFENKIRPLLVVHCLECHGADQAKIRGGLRLTSRATMLKGGDSGPALIPGKPEESLLISCVRYEDYEMPPEQPLSDEQIQNLVKWIEMGAPDPRSTESGTPIQPEIDIEAGREFWAFRPRVRTSDSKRLNDPSWVSR